MLGAPSSTGRKHRAACPPVRAYADDAAAFDPHALGITDGVRLLIAMQNHCSRLSACPAVRRWHAHCLRGGAGPLPTSCVARALVPRVQHQFQADSTTNRELDPMTRNSSRANVSALVIRGDATELARFFVAGCVVAPFSVGSGGDWRVTAHGVGLRHLYLYFDGRTLFAAASLGGPIAAIGGKWLGVRWSELPDGCELTFGGAAIAVTNPEARTSRPPPLPARGAHSHGPRISDPFANETLVKGQPSPIAFGAIGLPCDALEEPTRLYLPQPTDPKELQASLAQTIARPLIAPLAVTIRTPMPSPMAAAASVAESKSLKGAARTTLLRKCMAGLIAAALVLIAVRALTRLYRSAPARDSTRPLSRAERPKVTRLASVRTAKHAPLSGISRGMRRA